MTDSVNRRQAWMMTIGSFVAFFVFGVIDVLKGSTLSSVLEEMGFSYSLGGAIVMAAYFGFVVATLCTGVIADKGGKKLVLIIATIAYLIGVGGYAGAWSAWVFIFAFFCIGFGCGTVELGANFIIIDVQAKNTGRYLNLLATFYGVGSMLAPLYTSILFKAGYTWRDVYKFGLTMPALLLLYFLIFRYPKTTVTTPANDCNFRELVKTAFTWEKCLLYILVFTYVASEVSLATWLVSFLKEMRDIPAASGTTWLAAYFAGIMIGRFIGSFIVEQLGYIRMMIIVGILSIITVALGVFGPRSMTFMLPLTGLFYAIVLPTATAVLSTIIKTNIGVILGLFFCFVGLGGMAGPWLQGVLNDYIGVKLGMLTPAMFSVLMLVCLFLIVKAEKEKKSA